MDLELRSLERRCLQGDLSEDELEVALLRATGKTKTQRKHEAAGFVLKRATSIAYKITKDGRHDFFEISTEGGEVIRLFAFLGMDRGYPTYRFAQYSFFTALLGNVSEDEEMDLSFRRAQEKIAEGNGFFYYREEAKIHRTTGREYTARYFRSPT